MEDAPWWRTWRLALVVVVVVAVAAAGFLLGSSGGSDSDGSRQPSGVEWRDAVVVASDTADEAAAELLFSAADDGRADECTAVGMTEGGASAFSGERCAERLLPWSAPEFEIRQLDDYFGWFDERALMRRDGGWSVVLAGAVHPDVMRVTAHFGDGTEYSFVTSEPDGWFVAIVPPEIADPDVTDGHLINAPVLLEMFAGDGTRLASVDLSDSPAG